MTTQGARDGYCWVCHLVGPLLKCDSCPRSYHRNCMKIQTELYGPSSKKKITKGANPSLLRSCPECQMAKHTAFKNIAKAGSDELKVVCAAVVANLKESYREFKWPGFIQTAPPSQKDIVGKVMDLTLLEASQFDFRTLEGLLGEVKWIVHNAAVMYGRHSRELAVAKEVLEVAELEILATELCPECYVLEQEHEGNPLWFTVPCGRQCHLLGWAKTPGMPYWPVKVMQWCVSDSEGLDIVTVRSFADYRRFDIPSDKVFLYTHYPPKKDAHRGLSLRITEEINSAQAEMETHIQELEKVVGKVMLPDKSVKLTSFGDLHNALRYMFPEVYRLDGDEMFRSSTMLMISSLPDEDEEPEVEDEEGDEYEDLVDDNNNGNGPAPGPSSGEGKKAPRGSDEMMNDDDEDLGRPPPPQKQKNSTGEDSVMTVPPLTMMASVLMQHKYIVGHPFFTRP